MIAEMLKNNSEIPGLKSLLVDQKNNAGLMLDGASKHPLNSKSFGASAEW